MQQKRYLYTLSLLLVLSTSSCLREELVDPGKFLDAPEQLVVQGFLSPQDTTVYVFVATTYPRYGDVSGVPPTYPVYGTQAFLVSDATVTITGPTGAQQLELGVYDPYWNWEDSITYVYQIAASSLAIQAGNTYHLEVTTPDGHQVNGACTVPAPPPPLSYRHEILPQERDYCLEDCTEKWPAYFAEWGDNPDLEDYYYLKSYYASVNDSTGELYRKGSIEFQSVPFFADAHAIESYFSVPLYVSSTLNASWKEDPNDYLELELSRLTPGLYQYVNSWHQTLRTTWDGQSLLFEPQAVYSNVEGGIGIFEAYNRSTIRVYYPQE